MSEQKNPFIYPSSFILNLDTFITKMLLYLFISNLSTLSLNTPTSFIKREIGVFEWNLQVANL